MPFDNNTIFEKEDLNWSNRLKFFHSICIWDDSLLFSYEIELFDSSREYLCVDFFWQVASVGRSMVFQFLVDGVSIEFALMRLALLGFWVLSYPFETIIGKEFLHFLTTFSGSVSFLNYIWYFLDAIAICGKLELFIFKKEAVDLQAFLFNFKS